MSNMRDKILKHYVETLVEELDYYASELQFVSPIEQAFFEAFYTLCKGRICVDGVDPPPFDDPWTISAQHEIGPYRVDFVISAVWSDGREKLAAVECDGHEFHERTKEQAERDRKRDRFLQKEGYLILRYTGAEIYRDPMACAMDARTHLWPDHKKVASS